jgi:hypothetical protein
VGRHIHHIQNLTGALLECNGVPLQLAIRAQTQPGLDLAIRMANDVRGKVAEDYTRWSTERGRAV